MYKNKLDFYNLDSIKKYLSGYFQWDIDILKLSNSCNSEAFEINNQMIVKFSTSKKWFNKLLNEENISNYIYNQWYDNIIISKTKIINWSYPFSIQKKIRWQFLDNYLYNRLTEKEKNKLVSLLARFLEKFIELILKICPLMYLIGIDTIEYFPKIKQ